MSAPGPRSDAPLPRRLAVARGDEPADLVLRGGRVADLFLEELREADVAVVDGFVAAVGQGYGGREVVELDGRVVAPGLIDAHVHVESSLATPAQFARAVVPRGVTTVVTDPHEIANVCGLPGIEFMLDDAATVPLELFVNAPSCVPATELATSGRRLEADDLAPLLDRPRVLGLAEVMNYPGVVAGDPAILAKLEAFRDRPLDGHAPGLSGADLQAYVAAGIGSDHECTTLEEAREKLALGMTVFVREATNAHNLDDLLPLLDGPARHRVCFCTDDRQPDDLLGEGSVDAMVRRAVAAGTDPFAALAAATLDAATHYGLNDRGAVAPGRRADLLVVPSLEELHAEQVFVAGRRVAWDGEPHFSGGHEVPAGLLDTVRLGELDFAIPARGRRVRAIACVPDQLLTREEVVEAKVVDGRAVADPERDLAALLVFERHGHGGGRGAGFVRGLGLARGALAGTVLHDHHNLVVAGTDAGSMESAARAVAEAGGGLAVAEGEQVLARLPLPIAGLMSDRPIEEVRTASRALVAAARDLGSDLHDPFMALSFLGLEVIPELKLTDRGLIDVRRFEVVELFPR